MAENPYTGLDIEAPLDTVACLNAVVLYERLLPVKDWALLEHSESCSDVF